MSSLPDRGRTAEGAPAVASSVVVEAGPSPSVDAPERVPVSAAWGRRAVGAVARHPGLWATAARQALVLAAPGWWRRRPFLPLPAQDYLRFRLQTAYGGDGSGEPDPGDLVTYLRWCRDFPHSRGPRP